MSDSKGYLNAASTGTIKFDNLLMQRWLVPALVTLVIAGRLLLLVFITWYHAQKGRRVGCDSRSWDRRCFLRVGSSVSLPGWRGIG